MPTTWNPSDIAAGLTLSNGNLTATSTSSAQAGVRTIDRYTSGKYYWEYTFGNNFNVAAGLANAAYVLTSFSPTQGGSIGAALYVPGNGRVYINNTFPVTMGGTANGGTVCFAADFGAQLIWIREGAAGNWNGNASANPATGVGGFALPFTGIAAYGIFGEQNSTTSGNVTANFGGSAFIGAVPSGFTSGLTSPSTPASSDIVTQIGTEVWGYSASPAMQLTQIGTEVWIPSTAYTVLQTSGIVRETLYSYPGQLNLSGLVRETLRSTLTGTTHLPGVPFTYIISGSRAGLSGAIFESTNKTYVVAQPAVLTETPPPVSTVGLVDAIVSSEVWTATFVSAAYNASLSDTVGSADTTSGAKSLSGSWTDSASSSDFFTMPINYPITLPSDSAASSDALAAQIAYTFTWTETVVSSDSFYPQNAFSPALADVATTGDQLIGYVMTGPQLECGPIPIWPTLPESFPSKLSLVMDTTIGTTKSLREMRVQQQAFPLWDIELSYEELRDQTQNQTSYAPFYGLNQFEQLAQTCLMMYGRTGVVAYRAQWDNSRTDQVIATNVDGSTTNFPVFESWGTPSVNTLFPVGMINTVINVKVNGTIVDPSTYYASRSYINFNSPPPAGATIQTTFTFYYLCRFTEDEQDFDEWEKNRWTVPSIKLRAVYWPGCQ